MSKATSFLAAAIAACVVSACSGVDITPRPVTADEFALFEQELRPNLDLTTVLVARLDVDDQRIEATSLFPTALPTKLEPRTGTTRTWIWFDPDKTSLRVLTRGKDNTTQFVDIPVAELTRGRVFEMPIAQTDGSAKPTRIEIREMITKP